MIVAIYQPNAKVVFFKGWLRRKDILTVPRIVTTPDPLKAKSLNEGMARLLADRLQDQGMPASAVVASFPEKGMVATVVTPPTEPTEQEKARSWAACRCGIGVPCPEHTPVEFAKAEAERKC